MYDLNISKNKYCRNIHIKKFDLKETFLITKKDFTEI